MKKIIYLILVLTLGLTVFTSCMPPAPATHTVKFMNDGQLVYEETVNEGSAVANWPEDLIDEEENLVFAGWFNEYDAFPFNENSRITRNITLEAKWYATISIYDGENVVATQQVFVGSSISNLNAPDKEGFTFNYFELDGVEVAWPMVIDSNIDLVAIYTQN